MLSINLVRSEASNSSIKNDSDDEDAGSNSATESYHDSDIENIPDEAAEPILPNGEGELKTPTFSRLNTSASSSRILCKCGATNCRFYLFC